MTPFDLVLAALAAWQAVEVWQHGSIFATARASAQAWPAGGFRGWLGELLTCPFCQSVWVGTAAAAIVVAPLPAGDSWDVWAWWLTLGLLKLFGYGLAVSRLANLANDLTHGVSRTPNRKKNWAGPPAYTDAPDPAMFLPQTAPNTVIESPTDERHHDSDTHIFHDPRVVG